MRNRLTDGWQRALVILRSGRARKISTFIAILFSAIIFGYMIYREREILLNRQWTVNWWALLVAFVLYSLALMLASYVWVGIVNSLGASVGWWQHLRYFSVSMLAKRLPGTVWYVAYRSQMYEKEGVSPKVTSFASGLEFAVTIISGILVSLIFAIPILAKYQSGIGGIAVVFLVSLIILHPRFLKWLLLKLKIQPENFSYRLVFRWVLLYVMMRLLSGGLVFSIANIVYPLPLYHLDYVIGGWTLVGVLSNALLFLPTNMGFTEVTFSVVLTNILPSSIAVVVAVLCRLIITFFEFLWAISLVLTSKIWHKSS